MTHGLDYGLQFGLVLRVLKNEKLAKCGRKPRGIFMIRRLVYEPQIDLMDWLLENQSLKIEKEEQDDSNYDSWFGLRPIIGGVDHDSTVLMMKIFVHSTHPRLKTTSFGVPQPLYQTQNLPKSSHSFHYLIISKFPKHYKARTLSSKVRVTFKDFLLQLL